MGDKMQHQKTGLEKAARPQQNRHKPGERADKDPSGKLMGGLQGQQSGFDQAGQGDAMNLEQENRSRR